MDVSTAVGVVAAALTTLSNLPQLKKCWETGSTGDLSFKAFATLSARVALWIAYGFSQDDLVIVGANVLSLLMLAGILYFKLREMLRARHERTQAHTVARH